MNREVISELATALGSAWAEARSIPAPKLVEPGLSTDDAYAIQDEIIASRLADGSRVAGWKLGLTSAPEPTTPIAGTLLDDMVVASGTTLSMATMVGPMVEAELVVLIGADLEGPATAEELLDGPHSVAAGIEVIDYRTVDSTGPVDWIADNSTVAYAVVGEMAPLREVVISEVEASLSLDGETLATGRSSQVMGNPMAAVAWLSGHLGERGRTLRRGDVILTGSLTGHHVVPGPGVVASAEFGGLGSVTVQFAE